MTAHRVVSDYDLRRVVSDCDLRRVVGDCDLMRVIIPDTVLELCKVAYSCERCVYVWNFGDEIL